MELLYVVCQLAAASVCEEHRALMLSTNPLACVHSAQAELAQLTLPGWRVARWRCDARPAADLRAEPAPADWAPAALTE
jgi:hypothetical protein